LFQDSILTLKLKEKFDKNGNLLEKGIFIGKSRIGKHLFFESGYLKHIKYYVFFNKTDLKLLYSTGLFGDILIYKKFESYLNGDISLKNNGDTCFAESNFIEIKFNQKKIKLNDTLNVNIISYNSKYKIEFMDFYFFQPENNDYMIIAHKNGNNFKFKHKVTLKGNNFLKGYAIVTLSEVINKDTVYHSGVYKTNKKFTVY